MHIHELSDDLGARLNNKIVFQNYQYLYFATCWQVFQTMCAILATSRIVLLRCKTYRGRCIARQRLSSSLEYLMLTCKATVIPSATSGYSSCNAGSSCAICSAATSAVGGSADCRAHFRRISAHATRRSHATRWWHLSKSSKYDCLKNIV